MNTTHEERKEKAMEYLAKLDIYKPYIRGFKEENNVCYFENFAGFWAWQDAELIAKIKEIEEKHNLTVYAVTHEFTEFGEMYSLLVVTDYKEEWKHLVEKNGFYHNTFAYVWNKDDELCSEFGTITVGSFGGGIARIA